MLNSLTSKFSVGMVIAVFVFLSLATTGVAASKLWKAYQTNNTQNETLEVRQKVADEVTEVESAQKVLAQNTKKAQNVNAPSSTPRPTTSPTPTPNTNNNGCIVTLSSNQYDVSALRSSHPGGDIFKCGTDMTQAYQAQHGSNLSSMQKYLVTGSTANQQSTQSQTRYFEDDDHDRDESEEEKDRYVDKEDNEIEHEND